MATTASAVAALGLPTRQKVGDDPGELRDLPFAELLAECEHHRILGLLGAAVRTGALELSADARAQLELRLQAWLVHDLRVERTLVDAIAALDRDGIESRVLKGVALAHTTYASPDLRVFGDVDLLVRSADFTRTVGALEEAFATTRVEPELRSGFDERFGKEAMLRTAQGIEIDVHRTLVAGALGLTIDLDDLFADPVRFALGGAEMRMLAAPQRLLQTCYAAALGDWPPRLVSLRDAAEQVFHLDADVADVLAMARRWRGEAVVARALQITWENLQITEVPPIVQWAWTFTPSRVDAIALAAHQGPARAFRRHAVALLVIPGTHDRIRYARAVAFPQRSYLEARAMSGVGHVTRAIRKLR